MWLSWEAERWASTAAAAIATDIKFMALKASTPKITLTENGPPIGWLLQVGGCEDE